MDLAYLLLLKCSLFSAVFAWAWVDVLTSHRAILDFIPKYYPIRWADKPLSCAFCLSGWICLFSYTASIFLFVENWVVLDSLFYGMLILFSPFFAMAIVQIIKGNGR